MSNFFKVIADSFTRVFLAGIAVTLPLTAIAFTLAMVIAVVAALVQYAKVPVLTQITRFYIWVIRGTPLLVQLFIVFFGLPNIGIQIEAFSAAVLVFSINEGAYCAETIRGALESVPIGQLEAGYCAGMSYLQTMRRVILPQALKTAFPALSNSLISLLKDTSLTSSITLTEMFRAAQKIAARNFEYLTLYIEVAAIYLLFSTVLTALQRWGEKKLSAGQGG